MSPLESQILQQIAQLQSTMGGNTPVQPAIPTTSQPPVQNYLTENDVSRIAKQVLAEELLALKDSTAPKLTQAPQEISPLVRSINEGLTEEERMWLYHPDRLKDVDKHLPDFLLTEDGKLAIQSFIIYFRGLYEN